MSQLTLIGILGLVAIVQCWVLAVVLYRVGEPGSAAHKLALLLVVESLVLLTAEFPEMAMGIPPSFFDRHPVFLYFLITIHDVADVAMLVLYPPFLAAALQTNLTRAFASKRMRIGAAVAAVLLSLSPLVYFPLWDSPVRFTLLNLALTLLYAFALVASIQAWLAAPAGVARDRARAFAIAFGIRDVCWLFVYGASTWLIWTGTFNAEEPGLARQVKLLFALGTLFAVPLIAYGILRAHLFDIDLRIRWTIKQSTVAAVFVAVFYLVSEGADRLLESELGNVIGLIASALVMFFLVPVQRFAERIASAAMPNTENTPEYAMFRKMQVYEAALTEALPDGNISERERELLNRLRDSLGISIADAETIEGEQRKGNPDIR